MATVRPSTIKAGTLYRGVVRNGRNEVLWTCQHLHRNRDMSPGVRQSARDCAIQFLIEQAGLADVRTGDVVMTPAGLGTFARWDGASVVALIHGSPMNFSADAVTTTTQAG